MTYRKCHLFVERQRQHENQINDLIGRVPKLVGDAKARIRFGEEFNSDT